MDLVSKQREERKQRILAVAHRLIAERGYEGVTMRELADESLVSVPTLYNLFGGKGELLFAAVETYFRNLLDSAEQRATEEGLARVFALVQTLTVYLPRHADYARSLMRFFFGTAESTVMREFVAWQLTNELVKALEQMRARRQLVAWVEPEALGERLASLMVMTAYEWASEYISDGGFDDAMRFGVASMLLGFARGKTATELQEIAQKHQSGAVIPRSPESKSSGGESEETE